MIRRWMLTNNQLLHLLILNRILLALRLFVARSIRKNEIITWCNMRYACDHQRDHPNIMSKRLIVQQDMLVRLLEGAVWSCGCAPWILHYTFIATVLCPSISRSSISDPRYVFVVESFDDGISLAVLVKKIKKGKKNVLVVLGATSCQPRTRAALA